MCCFLIRLYLTVEMTELGLFSSSGSTASGLTEETDDLREALSFLSDVAELVVLFIEHVESFRVLLIDEDERDVSDFGFSEAVSDAFDFELISLARDSERDSSVIRMLENSNNLSNATRTRRCCCLRCRCSIRARRLPR